MCEYVTLCMCLVSHVNTSVAQTKLATTDIFCEFLIVSNQNSYMFLHESN